MSRYIWWALYLTCMYFIVLGLYRARDSALETYDNSQAKSAWNQWRDVAESESDSQGPVIRKPRESDEPPALVLMRDHFLACLAFALVLCSVLFATFAIMFEGAIARAPRPRT